MTTTGAQIRAALVSVGGLGGQHRPLDVIAAGADAAMAQAGITTSKGAAVFIAQAMVESAYFRTTEENEGKYARYAPYFGRGYMQVTFKDNYADFGEWAKGQGLVPSANYFVDVPSRLGEIKWAWLTVTWYLSEHRHNLIKLANAGDVDHVGSAVHTGDATSIDRWYPSEPFHRNRIDHTRKAYKALLAAGVEAPDATPPSEFGIVGGAKWTVEQVQDAVGTTADGVWGPATTDAVKNFQTALDLTADGQWGPTTEGVAMSLIEKIDAIAADLKQVKTDLGKVPQRVAGHKITTPKSVRDKFPSANEQYTLGGLMGYNLIDFYTVDRSEKTLDMLNDIDEAVSAKGDA